MFNYTNPKQCINCKEFKDLSEYYKRGDSGYLCSECKTCMKARSKRSQKVDRKVSMVASESEVIEQLHLNGIPALPGKALHHQWADVIAWGCVLIEVKSSSLIDRSFFFAFSYSQRNGKLRGDLVVLVCRYENKNTYHVFNATHPMFYDKDGKLKFGVSWTPDRHGNGRPAVVTDMMMAKAENRWQMIEDYRLKLSARLM